MAVLTLVVPPSMRIGEAAASGVNSNGTSTTSRVMRIRGLLSQPDARVEEQGCAAEASLQDGMFAIMSDGVQIISSLLATGPRVLVLDPAGCQLTLAGTRKRASGRCFVKEKVGRMGSALSIDEETLLDRALQTARDTRFLVVEPGARHDAARVFVSAFGAAPP